MGSNPAGGDARILSMHRRGFAVSQICSLVGVGEARVRAVVCAAWHDDKHAGKRPRKG